MEKIQVIFSFNDTLMKKHGIKRQDVYYTIKKNFTEKGLQCVSDGEMLVFEGLGMAKDYRNMWSILIGLIKSVWFISCVSSCILKNGDDEEDVLIQNIYRLIPAIENSPIRLETIEKRI